MAGLPVVAGIGNAETDDIAYKNNGLDSFIINHDAEAANPGGFYRNVEAALTDPGRLSEYATQVEASVADRALDPKTDAGFQRDLDILTGTTVTRGNTVQALIDGDEARPAIMNALESADETIVYHTFEFHNDELGNEMADKMIEKAQEGVKVRVSLDALGSKHIPPFNSNPIVAKLEAGGVDVEVHNPAEFDTDIFHRDHRKIIAIDGGELALIGGMNTGTDYMGATGHEHHYHDVFMQVDGPAARKIQEVVYPQWAKDDPTDVAPPTDPSAPSVRVVAHTPREDFDIKDAYIRMIDHAEDRLNIVNSFPMDDDLIQAVKAAAARGVEVNYIYGRREPDAGIIDLVTENKFPELLAAGVNIYQHPQPVHAKTITIDGKYASIGSSNVDNYALELNHESIAIISDPEWVGRYEAELVDADIAKSTPVPTDKNDPFWDEARKGGMIDRLWPDFLE
jgi:cardiolipin synthase